jgi:hypothetical protein
MRRRGRRIYLVLLAALAILVATVAAQSAMADDVASANVNKVKIELVSPGSDAVIPQNNPLSGCAFSSTRGYGLRIDFAWKTKHAHEVANYHLVAQLGTSIPIVDVTIPATSFTWVVCDSFVSDPVLTGWGWSVSALDGLGNVIATAQGTFSFAPCELADGTPCS